MLLFSMLVGKHKQLVLTNNLSIQMWNNRLTYKCLTVERMKWTEIQKTSQNSCRDKDVGNCATLHRFASHKIYWHLNMGHVLHLLLMRPFWSSFEQTFLWNLLGVIVETNLLTKCQPFLAYQTSNYAHKSPHLKWHPPFCLIKSNLYTKLTVLSCEYLD